MTSRRISLPYTSLLALALLFAGRFSLAQASPAQPGAGAGERSSPIATVPEKNVQEHNESDEYRHSDMVKRLGSMVGMNTEQAATTFEVLNFLVLAVGVGYLAFKMLPKAFQDRNTAIQKHLVDARSATDEASARLNLVEARLGRLDEEIVAMRSHVEAETARDEQRMRASIEEETSKILAAADNEIGAAVATARRDLQRHAAELAIEHAARRLVVSAETDRLLIQGFSEALSGDKGGRN